MKVIAHLNNLRISPRKTHAVARVLRGLSVARARMHLGQELRHVSEPLLKLLQSAVANAENNFGLDKDNLYIYDIQVGAGPTLKRWMPRAYGRATPINKRTARVFLTLEEYEERKGAVKKKRVQKKDEHKQSGKEGEAQEVSQGKQKHATSEKSKKKETNVFAPTAKKGVAKTKKIFQRKAV